MRVLSIDPGYDRVGLAVLEKQGGKDVVVFSECIQTNKDLSISERIHSVGARVREKITEYTPDLFAIETLFFTNNQKTAMSVAEARGVVIYEAINAHIPVIELNPLQIKTAVTGNGRASKDAVYKMVSLIVPLTKKKFIDDEIDAIAIGIAAFSYHKHISVHTQKQ